MDHPRLLVGLFVVAVAFTPRTPAHAQSAQGFSINRFEPSERGSRWFALESLNLAGHLRPAVGLVGEWAYRPLVIYNDDGSVRSPIISHQVTTHLGASLVLWDRLRVAANLPLAIYQDGDGGTVGTVTYAPPAHATSVGDLRLGADVRLVGRSSDAFTAAAGVQVYLPTGAESSFTGDGKFRFTPRLMAAGEVGAFVYAAKLGFQYRARSDAFATSALGSEFSFAGSGGLQFLDRKLLVGPELFGTTVVAKGDAVFKRTTTNMEGLLAIHYALGKSWRINGGVGMGITRGLGTPGLRTLLGVEWAPGLAERAAPIDTDGDGITDIADACPREPGVATENPRTHGCPPDRDGDGVLDRDDACVDVPGKRTLDPKTNGCPGDRDGDGVLDSEDACVEAPGQRTEDPRTNGCPSDQDGDGVIDGEDACPTRPGVRTTDPATNGCPPDTDGDTVLDDVDRCPNEPGKPDSNPRRNGCPKAFVQDGQIKILDQVKFRSNSAKIVPGKESDEVLFAVLKVLENHGEIARLRIEGHTDNRGSAKHNRKLSARRAQAVALWLVDHGIDGSRFVTEGFGPDRPLADNGTDEGRHENRRVEFHIEGAK